MILKDASFLTFCVFVFSSKWFFAQLAFGYSGFHLDPCTPCLTERGIVSMARAAVLYKSLLGIYRVILFLAKA